jgi:hypothetical protein
MSRFVTINQTWPSENELTELAVKLGIQPGGAWRPNCATNFKSHIVLPYRPTESRKPHLNIFLRHLHQFLTQQNIDYDVYIVQQTDDGKPFNKGILFNVGFTEISAKKSTDCFIGHDVDALPENAANLYACSSQPRHMAAGMSNKRYTLAYGDFLGGAYSLTVNQFVKANGFSNTYWGWGGEDDDFARRIKKSGMQLVRYTLDVSRYWMLPHMKAKPSSDRFKSTDVIGDGLSTINTVNYTIVSKQLFPLYTWLQVKIS